MPPDVPVLLAPTLEGAHVRLEPLRADHVDDLVAAAAEDRATYALTSVPDGPAATAAYVEAALEAVAAGAALVFVQRRLADGRIVGSTRFWQLERWSGRPEPDEVEVGWTWLAASAQRTAVNTEAKLLLLTHAFDVWGVWRVALVTDERNERSRRAIERIGATFEGVLRNHNASRVVGEEGRPRSTAVFSVVREEWPAVRDALEARLA